MVHENFPTGVIVTNGLGDDYQDLIIARFHLFLGDVGSPLVGSPLVGSPLVGSPGVPPIIEIEAVVKGRGVPHGLEGTRYDPRYDPRWRREDDDDVEPWVPPKDEKEVILKVRIGDKEIERHYFRKDADRMIKALNLTNKTKDNINVTVKKVKDTTQKTSVAFKGFRKKKDEEEEDKD